MLFYWFHERIPMDLWIIDLIFSAYNISPVTVREVPEKIKIWKEKQQKLIEEKGEIFLIISSTELVEGMSNVLHG